MRGLLNQAGGLPDWPAFAGSWDALEPDAYLAQVGRHRRRRYAVYSADRKGAIAREPHQPHYQSSDYNILQGDIELAQGLWLYDVPGHSAGQMAMIVRLEGRKPMFFPADACHLPRHLEEMIVPGFHMDPIAGYHSLERVKELQTRHDAEIFWGHPPGDSLVYRKAPEWYE
jgi:glyoxylase-like metal-dependent hydrolase (beta-lactamase superfamily II)